MRDERSVEALLAGDGGERIEHALVVERVLTVLGWSVLVIGVAGLMAVVVLWVSGQIDVEQALAALLGVVLGSILSGATAYGAGVNVGLGAARLEIALRESGLGVRGLKAE